MRMWAQWGGIASLVVRRHWCACMVAILATIRQCRHTLTQKEKTVMDKLVARRDLWTDDQYLALCSQLRPLGSESVKGNVGLGMLADLPSMSSARRGVHRGDAAVDLTGDSAVAARSTGTKKRRNTATNANAPRTRGTKRKKRLHARGEVDSLSGSSSDVEEADEMHETTTAKVHKVQLGGVLGILADMQRGSKSLAAPMTITVGGQVLNVGSAASKDMQIDAMGKRTRRQEQSAQELHDEFLRQILWWDFRVKSRQGPPCSKMPLSFESLDHYEDTLGPLLLEETWEQIASAYSEERAEVEDDMADFSCMRVLSYNAIDDFAYAAVRPNIESRAGDGRSSADAASAMRGNGLNEMDLVLLVSPDSFAGTDGDVRGSSLPAFRGKHSKFDKEQVRTEHVLALVEKSQHGDAATGIIRLKVLSRRNPRTKRFCQHLNCAAARDGESSAYASQSDKYSPENLARIRMVPLSYSISTSEREFVALYRLRSLEQSTQQAVLSPCLASAAPQAVLVCKGNPAVVPRDSLNQDQMNAIRRCLEPGPLFSLIQGPPGTGKTSTLVGLLTALLAGASGQVQVGARVLVCAPSNAAVDELAKRVSIGLLVQGCTERYRPSVVRIGAKRQMRPDVWDSVGLEQQVLRRLAQVEGEQKSSRAEVQVLNAEVDALTLRIEACETKADNGQDTTEDMQALQSARKQALAVCAHKAALSGVSESRTGVLKRQIRSQILDNAQIVCATLSGAGASLLQSSTRTFDAVIIDEAAQALEPSVLIPLQLNINRCILVGDPQQLPATVTSRKADDNLYARSLFERLQAAGHSSALLAVQYRMHPSIRAFPSNHFYGGKLRDCLGEGGRNASWHSDCRFGPFVFYDIKGEEDGGRGGTSRSNPLEAKACVALLQALVRLLPGDVAKLKRVAIMSPYQSQCSEIRRRLTTARLQDIEVSSIDAFQGREIDVAVLSCVRSGRGGLGFVADIRRLNVALTRARCSLLIVGDAATLSQNEHWAHLIAHARSNGCCVRLHSSQLSSVFGSDGARFSTKSWPEALLSHGNAKAAAASSCSEKLLNTKEAANSKSTTKLGGSAR